tara:strand:+ start:29 stop:304 length:276 start_codon:yes stop_codon:yes gene_type:complete
MIHGIIPRASIKNAWTGMIFSGVRQSVEKVNVTGGEKMKRKSFELEMTAIHLRLPTILLAKFDEYCKDNNYMRVEGVRAAIRLILKEDGRS